MKDMTAYEITDIDAHVDKLRAQALVESNEEEAFSEDEEEIKRLRTSNNDLCSALERTLEREKALAARIEFLNQQNTMQQEQNDALAAKVELAIEALDHRPTLQSSHFKKLLVHLREADTTTLARRDLNKRTEGTKMAALFIELKAYAYDDGAEHYNNLMELSDELHQQAISLNQLKCNCPAGNKRPEAHAPNCPWRAISEGHQ